MIKLILIIPCFLVLTVVISAQTGLIFEDTEYEEMPLIDPKPERGTPPLVKNLQNFCPTPGDQGDQPSCVAWALANAMTIQRAAKNQWKQQSVIDQSAFSVAYIYNQIKYQGDCDLGATFGDGLKLIKEKGNCLAQDLGYNERTCTPSPNEDHHKKALPYQIKDFRKIFHHNDAVLRKINATMDELIDNKPVVVGMKVPANFKSDPPYDASDWHGEEGHALLVIGYNDLSQCFLLMNSYGTTWGEEGFLWVDYQTFGQHVRYGFILMD